MFFQREFFKKNLGRSKEKKERSISRRIKKFHFKEKDKEKKEKRLSDLKFQSFENNINYHLRKKNRTLDKTNLSIFKEDTNENIPISKIFNVKKKLFFDKFKKKNNKKKKKKNLKLENNKINIFKDFSKKFFKKNSEKLFPHMRSYKSKKQIKNFPKNSQKKNKLNKKYKHKHKHIQNKNFISKDKRSLSPKKKKREISFNKLLKNTKHKNNPSINSKLKNQSFLYLSKFNKNKNYTKKKKNSIVSFEVKSPFLSKKQNFQNFAKNLKEKKNLSVKKNFNNFILKKEYNFCKKNFFDKYHKNTGKDKYYIKNISNSKLSSEQRIN